jgi:predicted AlkP superfamily pyrophosphatase or phosphodiesterase
MKPLSLLIVALAAFAAQRAVAQKTPHAVAEHVLVIGCDGMGSLAFNGPAGNTPVMDAFRAAGSWTLKARGVMPTVSSPNWASIIMGAGPEQHGVTSNDWETNKFNFEAIEKGPEGMFPTIFRTVREQRPSSVIACVHDWDGFGRLLERSSVNYITNIISSPKTTAKAVEVIKSMRPTLMFVHLDDVDHAGHTKEWKSKEYYEAVHMVDGLIGDMLHALDDANISSKTLVIITADHGGKGTHHGGESMDELLIPWLARGPGVAKGREIKSPVNTYDTASTVAHALGVRQPSVWIGRPVLEAFGKN